jgi:molybdopterin synthase catalytic subunit/molybdopterin converting factor small subunit
VTVRVLFFAYLKDVTGTPTVDLALADGARVRDALAAIVARWPDIETQLVRIPVVADGRVVDLDAPLADGAELAWLPPVGGGDDGDAADLDAVGNGPGVVRAILTDAPLDVARLISEVSAPTCGGITSFVGVVRAVDEGRPVVALTYEAYDRVAQEQIAAVAREALQRWPTARIALEHRTGRLVVGEASVAIAVACPHRAEAFACCRHLIDRVKEAVPVWKREEGQAPADARWLPGHDYRPADDT